MLLGMDGDFGHDLNGIREVIKIKWFEICNRLGQAIISLIPFPGGCGDANSLEIFSSMF
jgi:hypothetical protein